MSEVQFYNDGKPKDNVEYSEEEQNQRENPFQLNNMISHQESTSQETLSDEIDDQTDELDDTVNNRISERVYPSTSEGVDELNNPIDNSIPEISPSLSGEAIRDVPNEHSTKPQASFFDREESENFKQQWMEIQGKFVDEPRIAVQKADELVSEMIGQIMKLFEKERGTLETQWNQGADVSTEDLRQTLQHYRSFFNRLVV